MGALLTSAGFVLAELSEFGLAQLGWLCSTRPLSFNRQLTKEQMSH